MNAKVFASALRKRISSSNKTELYTLLASVEMFTDDEDPEMRREAQRAKRLILDEIQARDEAGI